MLMTRLYVACFTVLDQVLKYATHSGMRYGLLNFCPGTILLWSAALPTHFTSHRHAPAPTDVPARLAGTPALRQRAPAVPTPHPCSRP